MLTWVRGLTLAWDVEVHRTVALCGFHVAVVVCKFTVVYSRVVSITPDQTWRPIAFGRSRRRMIQGMPQATARSIVVGTIAAASVVSLLIRWRLVEARLCALVAEAHGHTREQQGMPAASASERATSPRRAHSGGAPSGRPLAAEAAAAWDLSGKVVLITGAAQGLGLACARGAHAAGAAALVLCDRNAERGRAAQRELAACGCECLFLRCDVGVPAEVAAAVSEADGRYGRVDCLVRGPRCIYPYLCMPAQPGCGLQPLGIGGCNRMFCQVNAAGDTRRAGLDETSVSLFDELISVNLRAPFLFTQVHTYVSKQVRVRTWVRPSFSPRYI